MGKRILLTGASGFLGGYIIKALGGENEITALGRNPVMGISREGNGTVGNFQDENATGKPYMEENATGNKLQEENNFRITSMISADLREPFSLEGKGFDMVIHAAGKAHVIPKSAEEKEDFFRTNILGTENLLAAIENSGTLPESFVFISSVSVYGVEEGEGIVESAPLIVISPYNKSKIEAESIISAWCNAKGIKCTILRLPLIAGKDAPGNLGAMVKAIGKKRFFLIGNGEARKSMVMAADVANIIPKAAVSGGIYNLTDGHHPSFRELAGAIWKRFHGTGIYSLPESIGRIAAFGGDLISLTGIKLPLNSNSYKKMTRSLTFSDSHAREKLGWKPGNVLENLDEILNSK